MFSKSKIIPNQVEDKPNKVTEVNKSNFLTESELKHRIYEVENDINLIKFTSEEFDNLVSKLS